MQFCALILNRDVAQFHNSGIIIRILELSNLHINLWSKFQQKYKGDVSNYGLSIPKNLNLILLSWESAFIPDYLPLVYFTIYHHSVFHPWGPPQGSNKLFCRRFISCTYSSIEVSVLIKNITLFLKTHRIITEIWITFWKP